MSKGALIQNRVHLQDHEFATVRVLLDHGYDIELIPPSRIKGLRLPDIMMLGSPWEIKSPEGHGKYTVQNTLQTAVGQSRNIIIDLRRCKMSEAEAIEKFEKEYLKSKNIRRMKIINKSAEIIDFSKK